MAQSKQNWRVYYVGFLFFHWSAYGLFKLATYLTTWAVDLEKMFSQAFAEE